MDELAGQNMLFLEGVLPFPVEARFGFCACMASLMTRDRDPLLDEEQVRKRWWYAYQAALVTSGLASGILYSEEVQGYNELDLHQAVPNDAYIPYAMASGGCRYHILDCPAVGEEETRHALFASLAQGLPVFAEGLTSASWSLVVGYEQGGAVLLGYAPYRRTHYPRPYRPDGFRDNWLFFKSKWYPPLKRLVVVDGFDAPPVPYPDYFRHWAWVLRGGRSGTLAWGMPAWHILLDRLRQPYWEQIDSLTLEALYEPFSVMFQLPQSRGTLGAMLSGKPHARWFRDWMGIAYNSPLDQRLDLAMYNANTIYATARHCMQVISETPVYEPHPGVYADRLRRPGVRRSALAYLERMQKLDEGTLLCFEQAVTL